GPNYIGPYDKESATFGKVLCSSVDARSRVRTKTCGSAGKHPGEITQHRDHQYGRLGLRRCGGLWGYGNKNSPYGSISQRRVAVYRWLRQFIDLHTQPIRLAHRYLPLEKQKC